MTDQATQICRVRYRGRVAAANGHGGLWYQGRINAQYSGRAEDGDGGGDDEALF